MDTESFSEADVARNRVRLSEVFGIILGRTMRELRNKEGDEPQWVDEASTLLAGLSRDGNPEVRLATLAALLHGAIYGLTLMSYGDASEDYINKLLRPRSE